MRINQVVLPALCAAILLSLPVARAQAAGNAAAGALVFEEHCLECHTYSGKNKKGPTLRGIVGRKAGSAPGYADYSEAVRKSGLVWSAAELDKYLTNPKNFSPSIRMKYKGMADAQERADLIEFLTTKK